MQDFLWIHGEITKVDLSENNIKQIEKKVRFSSKK